MSSFASARPYNATTGIDNNGDGSTNDRPVINGQVAGRCAFRGTPLYETSLFAEGRIRVAPGRSLTLRVEGFNVFNHANILGRIGTCRDASARRPHLGRRTRGSRISTRSGGDVPSGQYFFQLNELNMSFPAVADVMVEFRCRSK